MHFYIKTFSEAFLKQYNFPFIPIVKSKQSFSVYFSSKTLSNAFLL